MAKKMKSAYTQDFLIQFYADLVRIRKFEQAANDCFQKGMIPGNIHLGVGEEATMVGGVHSIRDTDYLIPSHRGHGMSIVRGADPKRMMAEIFGKKDGFCKGKGGTAHIVDLEHKNLGSNGIVGSTIPIAAGAAMSSYIKETDEVTLCFFGDGASNEGMFHEAINMAAAWKLPVVYVCVNNSYGVSTNIYDIINTDTISVRAEGYGIPGETIDGNDVLAVYERITEAVEYARAGNGPSLIECVTFRHEGHFCGDSCAYRPDSYMIEANKKDAIKRFKAVLIENGVTESTMEEIEKEIDKQIQEAVKFADESDFPDISEVMTDMFANDHNGGVFE